MVSLKSEIGTLLVRKISLTTFILLIGYNPRCAVQDFVFGLSVLVKGSPEEKLEWTFHLYDLDGDGVISREEMEDVAMSVSVT